MGMQMLIIVLNSRPASLLLKRGVIYDMMFCSFLFFLVMILSISGKDESNETTPVWVSDDGKC